MNVVGKVGSLISQGVYSVATPFHPFGGAVDIIVVEQEDGTYRSTPWYVRFGKFQGVLKSAEKVVSISVNGVDANFHMYLDNSGEAYFMREVQPGSKEEDANDGGSSEPGKLEPGDGSDSFGGNAYDCSEVLDEGKDEQETEEFMCRSEQSLHEDVIQSDEYRPYQYGTLDDVESVVESVEDTNSEMVLISVDGHILTAPISSLEQDAENVQLVTPQFHLGPGESSGEEFCTDGNTWDDDLFRNLGVSSHDDTDAVCHMDSIEITEEAVCIPEVKSREIIEMGGSYEDVAGIHRNDTFKSCLDLVLQIEDNSQDQDPVKTDIELEEVPEHTLSIPSVDLPIAEISQSVTAGIAVSGDEQIPESAPTGVTVSKDEVCPDSESKCNEHNICFGIANSGPECRDSSPIGIAEAEDSENKNMVSGMTVPVVNEDSTGSSVPSMGNILEKETEEMSNIPLRTASGDDCSVIPEFQRSFLDLGLEISLCGNLLRPGMGRNSASESFEAHRVMEEDFKVSGASIIKNVNLVVRFKDMYLHWDKCAHIVLGIALFGPDFPVDQKDAIPIEHGDSRMDKDDAVGVSPSSSRRWRLWPIPFRRVKSIQHSGNSSSTEDLFLDSEPAVQSPSSVQGSSPQSPHRQYIRTKVPTTEQIASLNLKDGQNIIAFSFSTRVLGKQEVDCHIYLWKWNARIVISDVDGTITKSDVLGQFMPLVGRDWTQTGVARLFSAIKENGYQLLFLSARAIVQAYLTRSFLLNLKQDGNALPNGPVVISPDGLFPSLYREVIRRAPHEFKIACLEDIRALFPSEYNPFYAGFGNRDTDELSYKKIGIPKGKIFIINPKGEVAINHRIHVKSYTSLHTLINDMFPPTSLVEQEDFNSWNYWKVPLPSIDD